VAVYIIWGSTYLAIRFVIDTLPPFFMAGTRFALAGAILYLWTRLRGAERPTRSHWKSALVVGGLMLLGGHGAVIWAEQWVASGLVSLLLATVPLWMALISWIRDGSTPNARVAGGLALGFAGVALLIGRIETSGESSIVLVGAIVVVMGAFLWANGSLYSRSARFPSSQLLAAAMEMIAGSALLLLTSLAMGEYATIRFDQVSERSMFSWLYLVIFGSLVAFTSYIWLLKATTPARVSTYAYVNPIVALFLGWALADEQLTLQNIAAAAVILTSVVIITASQTQDKTKEKQVTATDATI